MVDVMSLAQYILYKCKSNGKPINNLQLQKILYFIQGEHLAQKGMPLFNKDFEAWKYGATIRSVYSKYCGYGVSKIIMIDKPSKKLDSKVCNFVNPIVDELRELYPWDLVKRTHSIGVAWNKVYQNGKGENYVIPKSEIKKEFLLLRR